MISRSVDPHEVILIVGSTDVPLLTSSAGTVRWLAKRGGDADWEVVYLKRELNSILSSDGVYYTNPLILLIKNMLCSKNHCQKGFNPIPFSYKVPGVLAGA